MSEVNAAPAGAASKESAARDVVIRGVYVCRDEEFQGQVVVDRVSGDRVYFSGDAEGDATVGQFLKDYGLLTVENMTHDQLAERASEIDAEITASEEENAMLQRELVTINARMDALKAEPRGAAKECA